MAHADPALDFPSALVAVEADAGEAVAAPSGARPARRHYGIPHAGLAPFLDVPMVYNQLLEQFMERMARRERELRASPTLWYGG